MNSIHNTYAIVLIGEIINIIVADNFHAANDCARIVSNDAQAVECNLYRCSIGDFYKDGRFYFKDGVTEIQRESTTEESITALNAQTAEIETQNLEILYQVCLLQLGVSDEDINTTKEVDQDDCL